MQDCIPEQEILLIVVEIKRRTSSYYAILKQLLFETKTLDILVNMKRLLR